MDTHRGHVPPRLLRSSLRAARDAGRAYAMVPLELVSPMPTAGAGAEALGACGIIRVDIGMPLRVYWVCLLDHGHEQGLHGWPDGDDRWRAVQALFDQTDPVARIERRAMFELAQDGLLSGDALAYAGGMLAAGSLEAVGG